MFLIFWTTFSSLIVNGVNIKNPHSFFDILVGLLFAFVNIVVMKVAHLTHAIRVQRPVIVLTLVGLLGLSDLIVAVTAHILRYFDPIVVRTLLLFLGLLSSLGLDLGLLYHRHELQDQFDKHLVLPLVILVIALSFLLSHFSCISSWPYILEIYFQIWCCLIHLCHLDYSLLDLLQHEVVGCVRDALRLKKGRNLG